MLKKGFREIRKGNGIYEIEKNKERKKVKPWLGDIFSFIYDYIMIKSVIPKKLNASVQKHDDFLKEKLSSFHKKNILELAAGSGNLSNFIDNDNNYIGIDISKGLLKKAAKKFENVGFKNVKFYVCSAEELPLNNKIFDLCICNLSLNFFDDLETVVKEIKRVIKDKGIFLCSTPIPERNKKNNKINGTLRSEKELKDVFEKYEFSFQSFDLENGAIFYFKATLK